MTKEIYIKILDEDILVYAPVQAKNLGVNKYIILKERYPIDEKLQFNIGDIVVVDKNYHAYDRSTKI